MRYGASYMDRWGSECHEHQSNLEELPSHFQLLDQTNKSQFSISHLMDIPMGASKLFSYLTLIAVQSALLQLSSGLFPGVVWHVSYQGQY